MTSNTRTEEPETIATASSADANKVPQEEKSSDETKKVDDDASTSMPSESVGETTVETSVAEKETTDGKEKETQKEVFVESALSTMKANKKKKVLNPKDIIKTPNVHDVLLGRGKPFQNHDGNQSMLRIVDMYRKRYHESERAFKHEIIEEVLDIIKNKGGRFLERIDDFEKSYWNQVPHRMSYRKVGHAFRSNARRASMEKRGQAANQRRNASAMARASMMSQFMNNNENMMQRMPVQGVSLPDMMPVGGTIGLADAMGMGASILNDGSGISSFRQGAGSALNQTQRELLAHEQMLHSSRIERILGSGGNGLGQMSSQPSSMQSMLGGGADALPYAAMGGANLAGRSLQLNNMRRMMLLGSGGVGSHPNAYQLTNAGAAPGSRLGNMGLSNMGNMGDPSFK